VIDDVGTADEKCHDVGVGSDVGFVVGEDDNCMIVTGHPANASKPIGTPAAIVAADRLLNAKLPILTPSGTSRLAIELQLKNAWSFIMTP
jgi:hypothetical protein